MGRHDDAQVIVSAIAPQVHADGDPEERLNPVGDLLEQAEDIGDSDDFATVVPPDLQDAAPAVGEPADALEVLVAPRPLPLDVLGFKRHGCRRVRESPIVPSGSGRHGGCGPPFGACRGGT